MLFFSCFLTVFFPCADFVGRQHLPPYPDMATLLNVATLLATLLEYQDI